MQHLARQVQRPGDQQQDDGPPDEPAWWFVTDGKNVWWLASDGRWYPPTHEGAPPPPESLGSPGGSGFGLAALAIGIVVTLAGLIPLLLFIGWALTPT